MQAKIPGGRKPCLTGEGVNTSSPTWKFTQATVRVVQVHAYEYAHSPIRKSDT